MESYRFLLVPILFWVFDVLLATSGVAGSTTYYGADAVYGVRAGSETC